MRGIIFYKSDFEQANNKLNEIIDKYKIQKIETTQVNNHLKNGSSAVFENGDIWKVLQLKGSTCCGVRCNIAYVDRTISREDFYSIILPCLTAPPFTGFSFYGDGSLYVEDKVLPFDF